MADVSTASAVSPLENRRAGPSRCARRRCERERHRPLQVTVSPAPRELSDRIRGWRERTAVGSAGLSCLSFLFFFADGEGTGQKKMRERRVRDGCAAQCFACARPPTRGTRGLHRAFGARPTSCRPLSLSLSLRRDGGDVDKQGYRYRRRRHGTSFYGVCCCYSLACYTLVTTTTTTADAALQFAATCKNVLLAGKKKRARNGPVAREARRPLCVHHCRSRSAGTELLLPWWWWWTWWHAALVHLACVQYSASARPTPTPVVRFRAGAAPPVPRHIRDATGGSARGEGRHGRMAAEQMRLPCPARSISACRPSPQRHTTRHRWMVRCQTHATTVRSTVPVRR
jgi:hypothetical protein